MGNIPKRPVSAPSPEPTWSPAYNALRAELLGLRAENTQLRDKMEKYKSKALKYLAGMPFHDIWDNEMIICEYAKWQQLLGAEKEKQELLRMNKHLLILLWIAAFTIGVLIACLLIR